MIFSGWNISYRSWSKTSSAISPELRGYFSARGYNIESLSVAATLDPTTSMITIVTVGDDRIIEQIMKQLNKVVEVLTVVDLTEMRLLEAI